MNETLHAIATHPWVLILVNVATIASGITILVGVIGYFNEAGNRRKAKHYQAWQVVNSAVGAGGSGGRIDALQDLVADHVSLAGVDLTGAWLLGVRLVHADLRFAILTGVTLTEADLRSARLTDSDLRQAHLDRSRLERASLSGANLQDADLRSASLDGTFIHEASLLRATLLGATLTNASFFKSDLRHVCLTRVKGWRSITSMAATNIFGVLDAPDGFREWAISMGAVEIETDPDWQNHKTSWAPRKSPDLPLETATAAVAPPN